LATKEQNESADAPHSAKLHAILWRLLHQIPAFIASRSGCDYVT